MPPAAKIDPPTDDNRDFSVSAQDFAFLAGLVRTHTGIVLGPNKRSMVHSRLARRVRTLGLEGFGDYRQLLEGPDGDDELSAFINAMTTNLTRFFREPHHFDFLRDTALPDIAAATPRRLRVWSAGCSSGEEPYSIAMTLGEHVPALGQWDARILATDIDTSMVARGAAGLYGRDDVADVPGALRQKYFKPSGDGYQAADALRRLIAFKPLNLLGEWPMKGAFDVIFCRNVMIYFDLPTKTRLVERFARQLRPGGWLIVGHSETLLDQQALYSPAGRTIYRLKASVAHAE